ncbi:MAG: hypothetical protein DLM54_04695 [Acidimicrobiales bacterium]|nr:MAG: hypothetical protein DLM54_04695 [Acidimicrobiales bacterium]
MGSVPPGHAPPGQPSGAAARIGPTAVFDAKVDAAFDHLRGRALPDRAFYAASALGDHSLIWLILGVVRALRGGADWRVARGVFGVMGLESTLINILVKSVVRRRRPVWAGIHPHPLRQPLSSSFPSGHATSAFCGAGLLAQGSPVWPAYYVTAAVIAASRVHVRIHHASDVVGGVAIGILLGRLARRVVPLPIP